MPLLLRKYVQLWRAIVVLALAAAPVLGAAQSAPQDKGNWQAMSTTARGVTGDVAFLNEKISFNFSSYPLAQIRELTPAEVKAVLDFEGPAQGNGNLYRVSIPAEKKFLHHNTLCGSEETQWVVTYVNRHTLSLALFSGAAMPAFTPEAQASASNLCGTFTYTR